MEINNSLIQQWEPKIQKLLSTTFVVGMDRDDIAQELRIAIIKAANSFNKTHGAIFHTYLHTTMENTVRTLISKAKKREAEMNARPLQEDNSESREGWRDIIDVISHGDWTFAEKHSQIYDYDDIEAEDFIARKKLSSKEHRFIELRQEGMTMEEITKDLGESAYKVRQILRGKFLDLAQEYNLKSK